MKKIINTLLKVIFPILLGGLILLWVYRDFNFEKMSQVLLHKMNVWWMLLTLVFGVFSHILRGVRWQLALVPLKARATKSQCVYAVFVSYAASLLIPRVGEISRCGILKKQADVPFAQSLGTVVTERVIDMLVVGVITLTALFTQASTFADFFSKTGNKIDGMMDLLSTPHFYIIIASLIAIAFLLFLLMRTLSFFEKVKGVVFHIWEGVRSLRNVAHPVRFILYTLLIWLCYFLQFYLSFYCFEFTASLGASAGLVLFVAGTLAVVVPTPNGAGPWHFAIISMLVLYGVPETNAGIFAFIVHTIQTFLIILLGIYGMFALTFSNKKKKYENN